MSDDARGCLTVGSRPARIGIDVLVRSKHEAVMGTKSREERTPPKPKTPTFQLELPLVAEAGQAARLGAHLEVGRQFYNAVLSAGQRRLRRMRADPARHAARALPPTHKQDRRAVFSALRGRYRLFAYALHVLAEGPRVRLLAEHLGG